MVTIPCGPGKVKEAERPARRFLAALGEKSAQVYRDTLDALYSPQGRALAGTMTLAATASAVLAVGGRALATLAPANLGDGQMAAIMGATVGVACLAGGKAGQSVVDKLRHQARLRGR